MPELLLDGELKRIVDDIAAVGGYVWEKGWAARNAGNISVDVTEFVRQKKADWEHFPEVPMKNVPAELAGRFFLVTTTGSRFRELVREPEKSVLLVRIASELGGYQILWGGEGPESRPTVEFLAHMKIHGLLRRENLPQKAVLHSHPNKLITITHLEDYGKDSFQRFLWAAHVAVKYFWPQGVGMAPYLEGGTEELAEVTAKLFQKHKAVLWEKHGCTTIGTDAQDAFDLTDILNNAAEVFLLCRGIGLEPASPDRK